MGNELVQSTNILESIREGATDTRIPRHIDATWLLKMSSVALLCPYCFLFGTKIVRQDMWNWGIKQNMFWDNKPLSSLFISIFVPLSSIASLWFSYLFSNK